MADVLEKFERIGVAQKLLLLLVLLALVGVGFYFLAWQPLDEERTRVQRDITRANEEAATLRAAADQLDSVQSDLREVCELYTSVMDRLPREADFETLLRRLSGHASLTDVVLQSGVRASSSGAQQQQGRGGARGRGPSAQYNTLSVNLSLLGSYDQVTDFFHFLSRETRVINVKQVSFAVGGGSRQGGRSGAGAGGGTDVTAPRLAVSATIDTYYAREDARGRSEACENI